MARFLKDDKPGKRHNILMATICAMAQAAGGCQLLTGFFIAGKGTITSDRNEASPWIYEEGGFLWISGATCRTSRHPTEP